MKKPKKVKKEILTGNAYLRKKGINVNRLVTMEEAKKIEESYKLKLIT
jgi:hypothetical protein